MGTRTEVYDESQQNKKEPPLGRFFDWVLNQIAYRPNGLSTFTNSLVAAFRPALLIQHPKMGIWHATLDVIDPQDNQVAALVRVSPDGPAEPRATQNGMIGFEDRGRKLFAEPEPSDGTAETDLLLSYSFILAVSLEANLKLFREFAANEIERIRG